MQNTANFSLKKLEDNDTADLKHFNTNWDTLDAELKPTADPAQVPASNVPGKLSEWVSWITNRIKAITGKANWYDAPTRNMEQLNTDIAAKANTTALTTHTGDTTVHVTTAEKNTWNAGAQAQGATSTTVGAMAYNGQTKADGKLYGGATAPTLTTRLNYDGHFYATRFYNAVFADYAEYFEKGDDSLEPGDVVALDLEADVEQYIKATKASKVIVGVVSDNWGHIVGGDGKEDVEERYTPVGLAGRVPVKVIGKVSKGDYLVPSDIPGVAEATTTYIPGLVIGTAVEDKLDEAVAKVRYFITR